MLWRDLNADQDPFPMEAQFVVQEKSRKCQELFPLVAQSVLKSTYMENSLNCVKMVIRENAYIIS